MTHCSWIIPHDSRLLAHGSSLKHSAQITTLSAYAGLEELRSWMRAELFLTNFRPIPLTEHAVFQGCIYSKAGTLLWACVLQDVYQHIATTALGSGHLSCVILTSTCKHSLLHLVLGMYAV